MKKFIGIMFVLLLPPAALHAQAPYYQGKTISFVVGSGAGTAYDMYARLLGNHIGKYIPGNPSVIMQNMPAARRYRGGKFCLWSGQARWLDARLDQSGALFQPNSR